MESFNSKGSLCTPTLRLLLKDALYSHTIRQPGPVVKASDKRRINSEDNSTAITRSGNCGLRLRDDSRVIARRYEHKERNGAEDSVTENDSCAHALFSNRQLMKHYFVLYGNADRSQASQSSAEKREKSLESKCRRHSFQLEYQVGASPFKYGSGRVFEGMRKDRFDLLFRPCIVPCSFWFRCSVPW